LMELPRRKMHIEVMGTYQLPPEIKEVLLSTTIPLDVKPLVSAMLSTPGKRETNDSQVN